MRAGKANAKFQAGSSGISTPNHIDKIPRTKYSIIKRIMFFSFFQLISQRVYNPALGGLGSLPGPQFFAQLIPALIGLAFVVGVFAFVSNSNPANGNIGSLATANSICQSNATAAGLSGTFRAWLSTDSVNARTN